MEYIEWLGTALTIVSAVLLSLFKNLANKPWLFFGYLFGSICWCIVGIETKDKPLVILNAFFCLLNMIAIFIRIGN